MLKFRILVIAYCIFLILSLVFVFEFFQLLILLSVSTIVFICTIIWGVYNIQSQMFLKTYNSNHDIEDKIAITFDDGPHKKNTPKLLDLLKKHKAKASFFLIGSNISENKKIAEKIFADGHLIGNHSYFHSKLFPLKLPNRIRKELEKAQEEIRKTTFQENQYFRPPYGVTNPFVAKGILRFNFKVIGWSIRSFDTTNKSKESILKRITKNLKGGDIILLHDRTVHVCWLTEGILKYLKKNKLKAVTVDELFS